MFVCLFVCLLAHNSGDLNEDEQQAILKEEKSRERNRDHSRKSRLRKKEFVESLKHEVNQLQIYQQICEQCLDLIALVSQDAIFMYSSAAYSRVLGYQGHQIVAGQTSFLDLVHPVRIVTCVVVLLLATVRSNNSCACCLFVLLCRKMSRRCAASSRSSRL